MIDDAWTQHIMDLKNGILNNPANQVNEEERKRITEELLAQGLSEETSILLTILEDLLGKMFLIVESFRV